MLRCPWHWPQLKFILCSETLTPALPNSDLRQLRGWKPTALSWKAMGPYIHIHIPYPTTTVWGLASMRGRVASGGRGPNFLIDKNVELHYLWTHWYIDCLIPWGIYHRSQNHTLRSKKGAHVHTLHIPSISVRIGHSIYVTTVWQSPVFPYLRGTDSVPEVPHIPGYEMKTFTRVTHQLHQGHTYLGKWLGKKDWPRSRWHPHGQGTRACAM